MLQSGWKSSWGHEVRRGLAGGEASDLVSPGRREGGREGGKGKGVRSEWD